MDLLKETRKILFLKTTDFSYDDVITKLYSLFNIFCRLSFFFDSFFLAAGSSSTAPPVRVKRFSFSLNINSI